MPVPPKAPKRTNSYEHDEDASHHTRPTVTHIKKNRKWNIKPNHFTFVWFFLRFILYYVVCFFSSSSSSSLGSLAPSTLTRRATSIHMRTHKHVYIDLHKYVYMYVCCTWRSERVNALTISNFIKSLMRGAPRRRTRRINCKVKFRQRRRRRRRRRQRTGCHGDNNITQHSSHSSQDTPRNNNIVSVSSSSSPAHCVSGAIKTARELCLLAHWHAVAYFKFRIIYSRATAAAATRLSLITPGPGPGENL